MAALKRCLFFCGTDVFMKQKRQHLRSRVLKGAKIVIGDCSLFDCLVRDLTKTGARVKIANTVHLPDRFALSFDGGRSFRECAVIWREFAEAGIQFLDVSQQSAA